MEKGELTFITGGVRSGKSSFAERLSIERTIETGNNLHYVACGIPFDGEMQERIDRHKADRIKSSFLWKTWEQPTNLTDIASHFSSKDIVLVDCVTTLLNNYLFKDDIDDATYILKRVEEDITSLIEQGAEVIVVSNEVLHDTPYEDALTRNYQYILGNIHQRLVKAADHAILVESGIAICKKGRIA